MVGNKTFAGFPFCADVTKLKAKAAVFGIPFGFPYDTSITPSSANAPNVIRAESNRFPEDPIAWDFDLGSIFQEMCGNDVVDCGDLPGSAEDGKGNSEKSTQAILHMLVRNVVPVVLGGDDSIPIPVLRAYEGQKPFTVLQLDAHIDWRDEVKGVRDGYSSTMRRASEMPWVDGIVQVGARGVGSARAEEYQSACDYGAKLVTAREFHSEGLQSVLSHLQPESRTFITIDLDVLDPSIMPAVDAITPGGIFYQETVDLMLAVCDRTEVAGVCVIGLVPELDLNSMGTITAMRLTWAILGALCASMKD